MAVAPPLASLLLALLLVLLPSPLSAGSGDAHPGYPSGEGTCTVDSAAAGDGGGLRLPERGGGGERGRIIDITHAYVPDLPAFAPGAVAGPVVRLKQSMAEGSEYNLSELRMECHTGTHVDAPGHINQDNFAAGLDVDTLDLDVLNERVLATGDDGGIAAHPGYTDAAWACGPASAAPTAGVWQLEEYDSGCIFDITHAYGPELPGIGPDGLGPMVFQTMSMANGSFCNLLELRMVVHAGTHIDTPGHMIQEYFEAGLDAYKLDLVVLNGPALLVDVPRNTNITAEAMEFLQIPKGVRRVLFRTLNTDRKLMWKKAGDLSYVGFTEDGAQWLVDNTDIKLIGVDYLSVAAFDHLISAHVVFFKHPDIIPVEGLKLDDVPAGIYNLHCLPLRLVGAEGSPVRCILIK